MARVFENDKSYIMNNSVLFVGNASSPHIIWFADALNKKYSSINIDIFDIVKSKSSLENLPFTKNISISCHYPKVLYKIPILRGFLSLLDISRSFSNIARSASTYKAVVFLGAPLWKVPQNELKRISKKTIIYPFGSEVLRCKWYDKFWLKRNFDLVELIATIGPSLKRTLLFKYRISPSKIVDWYLGIDSIENFQGYNRDCSKEILGLKDKFVITCGYNGYKGQNHFKILNEICKIKYNLPPNYCLLILLSYGCSKKYVEDVKKYCNKNGLNCVIIDTFMTSDQLIHSRFATDIFIHAQPTDNCSNSIYEFLLSGAKMINGSWIRYDHLEKYEVPYFIYDTFDELGNVLLKSVNQDNPCSEKTKMILMKGCRNEAIVDWGNYFLND